MKHYVGRYFNLAQIPAMFEKSGSGGVFSFVELEEDVHPIIDSVMDKSLKSCPIWMAK